MVMLLNLKPGDTVIEAGSGSGGLTMFLSRAVGPSGRILSVDLREDFSKIAKKNFLDAAATGACPKMEQQISWVVGDASDAATFDAAFDQLDAQGGTLADPEHPRLVHAVALDMIDPEKVLPVVQNVVHNDGSVVCYVPSITQAVCIMEAIEDQGLPFIHERTLEVTHREWKVKPPICRPEHASGRHTAFLVHLRRTLEGPRADDAAAAAAGGASVDMGVAAEGADNQEEVADEVATEEDEGRESGGIGGFWPFGGR